VRIASCIELGIAILLGLAAPARAQGDTFGIPYDYIVNTRSPDDSLTLRTEPSSRNGLHIMTIPDGTLFDAVERRADRRWYVRVLPFGQEGWLLTGRRPERWVECCRTFVDNDVPIPILEGPVGFKTPSSTVHCVLEDTWLRCDMKEVSGPTPARPPGCYLDWGDAFVIEPLNSGYRLCHGDTVADDALSILPYGSTWSHGGFTCRSEPTVLICTNAVGHGFSLSRTSQKVF
jgi:hypothetical protein